MMLKIEIETTGSAFNDGAYYGVAFETARILKKAAAEMEGGRDCGLCKDYNGNIVGKWTFEEEKN